MSRDLLVGVKKCRIWSKYIETIFKQYINTYSAFYLGEVAGHSVSTVVSAIVTAKLAVSTIATGAATVPACAASAGLGCIAGGAAAATLASATSVAGVATINSFNNAIQSGQNFMFHKNNEGTGNFANKNFASKELLDSHYEKHAVKNNEFHGAYKNADEYFRGARDVMSNGTKVEYLYNISMDRFIFLMTCMAYSVSAES